MLYCSRDDDQHHDEIVIMPTKDLENSLIQEKQSKQHPHEKGQVLWIINLVSVKYRGSIDSPIAGKVGKLFTTEAEPEACLAEHLNEVLNRPLPAVKADIQDPDVDIILLEREVKMAAIRSLDNGKTTGHDNLDAEHFNADTVIAAKVLQLQLESIWEENNCQMTGRRASQ